MSSRWNAMAIIGGAQWRPAAAALPAAHSSPDRWAGRWGEWALSQGNVPRGPHLPYMVLHDGARNPSGWAPPIREPSQGPSWPTLWANWWRSTLTFPPWSHLMFLNLGGIHFITNKYTEHGSS
jgi:hypothetical protein